MTSQHALTALTLAVLVAAPGCPGRHDANASKLEGTVKADGSSTVYPISEAAAEEFQKVHPRVRVTVGISGTGGGFKKFTAGETDISDASRPIKEVEMQAAAQHGVEYIELPVAFDGLSVMVNPKNTWVDHLTVDELKRIWQPGSTVKKWSDVRAGWPAEEIRLFGAGHDSGTFDYFTEAICGKEKACRSDFTASEDDNFLVQGIAGEKGALGFFGYAYYVTNQDKLKIVPIDTGSGPVAPNDETIRKGTYKPLSRPVFIYVSRKAADRPEVQEFVKFYIASAKRLVPEAGYIPLPDAVYEMAAKRFEARRTGTVYGGKGAKIGIALEELFKIEG